MAQYEALSAPACGGMAGDHLPLQKWKKHKPCRDHLKMSLEQVMRCQVACSPHTACRRLDKIGKRSSTVVGIPETKYQLTARCATVVVRMRLQTVRTKFNKMTRPSEDALIHSGGNDDPNYKT